MANKKSDNSEIAVLQTQMETALKTLDRMEGKMDSQGTSYAPKSDFEAVKKEVMALKEDNDKVKGAITLLKGATAFLTLIGIVLGALWWLKA